MSEPERSRHSLPFLLAVQSQNAFNDNIVRWLLTGLAQATGIVWLVHNYKHLAGLLLVIPFVVFAPLAGWMSDRYSKRAVINWCIGSQLVIFALIAAALYAHSIGWATFGFLLLAIQSAFFSPAKYGILKELVGSKKLAMANGWMGMLTVVFVLLGSMAGGEWFDALLRETGDFWKASAFPVAVLSACAIVPIGLSFFIKRTVPQAHEKFSAGILVRHFKHLRELWSQPPLRMAAVGIGYFWSLGAILMLSLTQRGVELYGGDAGSVSESTRCIGRLMGGIAVGSILAAFFSRRRIEIGLAPVGGFAVAFTLAAAGFGGNSALFYWALFGIGISGGLWSVPLNAYLQDQAHPDHRGRVLAASNLLTNLGTVTAMLLHLFLEHTLRMTSGQQFLLLAVPSLFVAVYVARALPDNLMRVIFLMLVRAFYRIRVTGESNVPEKGGALIISNHITWIDGILLGASCPRPIRYMADQAFFKRGVVGWVLRTFGVVPVNLKSAAAAVRTAADAIEKGEIVCMFPEGALGRTGTLQELKKGYLLIARRAKAPVIPTCLDGAWGSLFSFEGGKYFYKWPKRVPYRAAVSFGPPIQPDALDESAGRQAMLELGAGTFAGRPELDWNLGFTALKGLKRARWSVVSADHVKQRRVLRGGVLRAIAVRLALRWRKSLPGKRVGVVLPAGSGSIITNLALTLAGKVPVNLQPAADPAVARSQFEEAGLDAVVAFGKLFESTRDHPWPEPAVSLGTELRALAGGALVLENLRSFLEPSIVTAWRLRLPRRNDKGDPGEAAVLMEPLPGGGFKACPMSHRNVLANVHQVTTSNAFDHRPALMTGLPASDVFGFFFGLWIPLVRRMKSVTAPGLDQPERILALLQSDRPDILAVSRTEAEILMNSLPEGALEGVRAVFAPTGCGVTAAEFEEKLGAPLCEGFGAPSVGGIVSLNLPDPDMHKPGGVVQTGAREGSAGRLIAGVAARVRVSPGASDADKGPEENLFDEGELDIRGANLPGSERELDWRPAGCRARFDRDGFLFLEPDGIEPGP